MKDLVLPLDRAGRILIYLSIFLIPLANAPITADTLEIKTHLFRILGFAAGVLSLALTFLRSRPVNPADARGSDRVDLGVALGMAGLAVSLIGSESRMAAIPGALDAAASFGFFCLARLIFSRPRGTGLPHPIFWVVGLSAVLPAILFVAEFYRTGITDTMGNQNVVSHYLLLALGAPVYLILKNLLPVVDAPPESPWPGIRIGSLIAGTIFLAAILWVVRLTAARGAVVGLLVAAAVLTGLTAARYWRRFPAPVKIAVGFGCALLALAAPALLYQYATSTDFNVSVRFLSWKYSISLLTDRWAFGYGPGMFAAAFEKTKLWMTDPDLATLNVLTVNYAHNDYVELAVDQGAFGLAAFLYLVAVCLAPAAGRWIKTAGRSDPGPAARVAVLFGLTASLAQAFFDFPYHVPAPRLLFYILLGLIASPESESEPVAESGSPEKVSSWATGAVALALAAAPAAAVLPMYSAGFLSKIAEPQFKSGRYDEVKPLHVFASRSDPTRSQYAFRLGLGEEQVGNAEAARLAYRTALSLQPYFPNSYFHLGTVALKDDPGRAAASFYAALAFNPNATALHNLAAMALSLGDSPAAASIYTEIARRDTGDIQARNNARVLLMPQNQPKPELFRRALNFYQIGNFEGARPLAERYLTEHPTDPEGMFLLGRILFHQNRYEDSIRHFQNYVSAAPDDPEGHYYLGNAHFVQTRHRQSLPHYLRAAALNPESPKILYNLGVAYFSIGDAQSMNNCFDSVLAINPNVSTRTKMEELRRMAKEGRRP